MIQTMLYFFASILLIAGSLNWGIIGVSSVNPLEKLLPGVVTKIIYILVGLAAIFLLFKRDYYLPFLGKTVVPCSLVQIKTPEGADKEVTMKVSPNTKVVYWASKSSSGEKNVVAPDPWTAYGEWDNSGVALSDNTGNVVLKVKSPIEYKVPTGKKLKKHIHYRLCEANGMMSRVHTIYV